MDFSCPNPSKSRLVLGGHLKAGPLWPSELATFEGGHCRSGFHGTKRHLDKSRGGRATSKVKSIGIHH